MTGFSLSFTDRLSYSKYDEITAEVLLSCASSPPISVRAKVDTGSKFCIFQPQYASLLGFRLESGMMQRIRTATGSFTAYGHDVTIAAADLEWGAVVYFAEMESFPVNVLGRIGFLDRLRIGLVDYDQLLYIGPYDAA